MRVLVVGLPLFAERLQNDISEFDKENTYIYLNTYYNTLDRIKAFFLIPFVDVVISINGTVTKSKVFDLALLFKKKIIFNWVGTDVSLAAKNVKIGTHIQKYIDYPTHLCEVSWIQEELKSIGIDAKVQNFACFDKEVTPNFDKTKRLNVLTYIADSRPDFYGIDAVLKLAKSFPNIDFHVVGTKAEKYFPLPNNFIAHGWVSDMNSYFDKAHVCLRHTDHDGLSNFILEGLARGKQIVYNNDFPNCAYVKNESELFSTFVSLSTKFNDDKLKLNQDGIEYVQENFSRKVIFRDLIKIIESEK